LDINTLEYIFHSISLKEKKYRHFRIHMIVLTYKKANRLVPDLLRDPGPRPRFLITQPTEREGLAIIMSYLHFSLG